MSWFMVVRGGLMSWFMWWFKCHGSWWFNVMVHGGLMSWFVVV